MHQTKCTWIKIGVSVGTDGTGLDTISEVDNSPNKQ